jgi:hypothetical protein
LQSPRQWKPITSKRIASNVPRSIEITGITFSGRWRVSGDDLHHRKFLNSLRFIVLATIKAPLLRTSARTAESGRTIRKAVKSGHQGGYN